MMNTTNVNSARRPRRLPASATALSRAPLAARPRRGGQRSRGIPRSCCLDTRGKHTSRRAPGLRIPGVAEQVRRGLSASR
jgi:hypothetical protein